MGQMDRLKPMSRLEEIKLDSLQDSWVIMFTFLGKALLEEGVITEEEFAAKKKQLMGL